jgi:predicted enzyme related to lactoylglutathione lyase
MADLKISQLPAATTPLAGTEVLPIVQGGSTVQVSVNNLTAGKAVSASTVSATTVTATTVNGTFDTNVAAAGVTLAGTTLAADGTDTNISVTITPKGTGVVTTGSTYSDVNGALRAIPRSGAAKTSSYTLAVTDVGEYIEVGSGGSITIPNATFATGDAISIFNNTAGNITITCTITTAYISGIDADAASVTLATRGICTVLFISGTVCVISGNVV